MAKKQIFSVTTPLGYRVILSRDRWRQIIRFKHPAMKGSEMLVRKCLENPDTICESSKQPDVHLYYNKCDGRYVCVVTAPREDVDRFVVTAYFTQNIKKGNELWTK